MQADIRNEVLYAYERELEKQQKPDQAEQRKALETEEEDQQKEGIQAPELPENHPAEKNQAQELQEEQRKEQEGVREPAGNQQEESPQALEPAESIKLFFAAHEKGNLPKMLDIVKNANVDVDRLVTYVKNGTEIESQYASIISGEDMLVFRFLNNYGHLQEEMPAEPLSQRIEAILYKNGKNAGVQTLYERYSRNGADALENYQEMEGYWKKLTKQGSIQPEKTRGQEKRPVREPAVSAQAPKI